METSVSSERLFCQFVRLASRVTQLAEVKHPRRGPGRKPEIADWLMANLVAVAVTFHKRSKSV